MSAILTRSTLENISDFAKNAFGENMLFSFIGGSYAKNCNKRTSDIDIFVVLKKHDYPSEKNFATRLKELHSEYGLNFSHAGEIIDLETLEHLMEFTSRYIEGVPEVRHFACYHADCLLSIFRKGDIIFGFLLNEKCNIIGDKELLRQFTNRAQMYLEKNPLPRIQTAIGGLFLPEIPSVQEMEGRHRVSFYSGSFDNCSGIGLRRWYGKDVMQLPKIFDRKNIPAATPAEWREVCPFRVVDTESELGKLLKKQCLAFILSPHPEASNGE